MKLLAALLAFVTVPIQPSKMSPRDLLVSARPLTNAEIAVVLAASQRAIAGKTFRLVHGIGQGPEILMGRNGMPRRVRWSFAIIGGKIGGARTGCGDSSQPVTTPLQKFTTITDYPGRSAHDCNPAIGEGDLVVEYRSDSSGRFWTITPRLRDARDFGGVGIAPVFDMLQDIGIITSG